MVVQARASAIVAFGVACSGFSVSSRRRVTWTAAAVAAVVVAVLIAVLAFVAGEHQQRPFTVLTDQQGEMRYGRRSVRRYSSAMPTTASGLI
jgi:hypothetical protein